MNRLCAAAAVVGTIFLFSLVLIPLANALPTVSVSPTSWVMDVGQSKTFTANPTGGSGTYSSYAWYVDSTLQSGQTAATLSYSPGSSGSHSITVTVTDNLGGTSAQSTA